MASQIVNLLERRAEKSNDEAVAEYVPLADGGIAIVAYLDGTEAVWEFDREQTEMIIRALTLAFVTRKPVRIVQPFRSAA